jgi:hypothetical protein
MGLDAKKSFTKVNKNGNMNYGVWIQMKKFQFRKVEQASKEIRRREGQSPLGKESKPHGFAGEFKEGIIFSSGMPFHHAFLLEEPLCN